MTLKNRSSKTPKRKFRGNHATDKPLGNRKTIARKAQINTILLLAEYLRSYSTKFVTWKTHQVDFCCRSHWQTICSQEPLHNARVSLFCFCFSRSGVFKARHMRSKGQWNLCSTGISHFSRRVFKILLKKIQKQTVPNTQDVSIWSRRLGHSVTKFIRGGHSRKLKTVLWMIWKFKP